MNGRLLVCKLILAHPKLQNHLLKGINEIYLHDYHGLPYNPSKPLLNQKVRHLQYLKAFYLKI